MRPDGVRSGHGPCAEEDVGPVPDDIKAHARGDSKAPGVVGLDGEGVELRRLAAGDVVGEILRRARGGAPAAQAGGWALQGVGDGDLELPPPPEGRGWGTDADEDQPFPIPVP